MSGLSWAVRLAAGLLLLAPAAAHASHRVAVPISGAPGNVSAEFLAASPDGSKVLFGTSQAMLPEDQDEVSDIYQREGGRLTLVSTGDGGFDDPQPAQFMTATPNLSHVVWQSREDVTGTDFDSGQPDLFLRSDGQTTQLTNAQIPSFASVDPFFFVAISTDGSHVAFQTNAQLVFADNDGGAQDVYENFNGIVRLASAGGSGPVSLRGMSANGSRLFMSTTAQLIGADTDAVTDLYERVNGTTTNLLTPATTLPVDWAGASTDGSHVYFHTSESLNAVLDTDARRDVYERAANQTVLLSTSATAGNGAFDASFQRASADGTRVIFTTLEGLDPADDDGVGGDPYDDIYLRAAGVTTLVTAGSTFDSPVIVSELSPDGLHVFWWSNQTFADDQDAGYADAWHWDDGTITRISVGEQDDQGDHDAFYAGRAADNSSFVFQSEGQLTAADTDPHDDLYLRTGGTTRLLSPTPDAPCTVEPVSSRCIPVYKGVSADASRVWFTADENLHPADGDVVVDDPQTPGVREDQHNTDVYESRVLGTPAVGTTAPTNAYVEGDPAPIDPELTITEASDDIFGARVQITAGFEPSDILAFTDQPSITGALNAAGDTLTLTGRGTAGDFEQALRSVTYTTSSETPSADTRTIEFTVDNGGHTASATRSLTVTAANDVPILTPGSGPADYIEGAGAVAIAPELTASDADSTTLAGATIRIADGFAAGEDVLSLTAAGAISGQQDGDTLTLTGTAPIAQYEAVLRTVTYENVSENPTEVTRLLELVVTDGEGQSNPGYVAFGVFQRSIDVTNATLTYVENAAATVIDPGVAITNFDPDVVQGATVTITLGFAAGEDVLAFSDTPAITGTLSAGGRKLTLAGEATIADYVAALRSVTYRNTSQAPSGADRIVTFTVVDGLGSDARRIDVVPVDDAPVLTRGAAGAPYVENGLPATIAPALSATDVDSATLHGAVVRIEGGLQAGADELVTTEKLPDAITGQWNPATATFTLSGIAALDDYVAALRSIALTNDSENPSGATRTVSFAASSAEAESSPVSLGIGVTPINDPPEVGVSGTPLAYAAGDDPVAVDGSLSLADPDSTIQGATVKLVSGQQEGEDVLEAPDRDDGITVSIDAAEQTATLAGPASVTAYRTALREILYSNRSAAATGDRVVEIRVTDGPSVSAAAARTITLGVSAPVAATAPVITGVARVGAVLTASAGDWTGSEPMTRSPQWQRCTGNGTGCTDIAGATGLTYAPVAEDIGLRLRLLVVADNAADGTVSAASAPTAAVRSALAAPQILTAPASVTAANSAAIRFEGEDGATFTCAVDGGAFAACVSPLALAGLGDGPHALQVRQHREGLTSPAGERRWSVDTVAPAAPTLLSGPDPISALRTATVAFAGEPGARFDCALDDAGAAGCTSPARFPGLALGAHSLHVRAIDAAGNASPPLRVRWTVGEPPAAARATRVTLRAASAISRRARRMTVGCALDAGVLRRCEVVARLQRGGRLVRVGRGVVVPTQAQRSAAVVVRFTANGRRLLRRVGAGGRIRLTGFARTAGAPSGLVDTATVRVR